MLSQTLFSGTDTHVHRGYRGRAAEGRRRARREHRLRTGCWSPATRWPSGLPRLLEILADVLTDATYPADEVATERERLADRIQMARSQPAHLVRVALLKRVYGTPPVRDADADDRTQVRAVKPAGSATLHAERLHPTGAMLVIVGDIDSGQGDRPGRDGARRLDRRRQARRAAARRRRCVPGPIVLVDRPGSVQSSIRLALPAVGRTHPDFAALQLANLDLRRLLLVPLGGEHPRGQGLHVQPALG